MEHSLTFSELLQPKPGMGLNPYSNGTLSDLTVSMKKPEKQRS